MVVAVEQALELFFFESKPAQFKIPMVVAVEQALEQAGRCRFQSVVPIPMVVAVEQALEHGTGDPATLTLTEFRW